jgi:hypothetical protein
VNEAEFFEVEFNPAELDTVSFLKFAELLVVEILPDGRTVTAVAEMELGLGGAGGQAVEEEDLVEGVGESGAFELLSVFVVKEVGREVDFGRGDYLLAGAEVEDVLLEDRGVTLDRQPNLAWLLLTCAHY